ncbi:MAG: ExeM/NucH family extracellular endonuclease [Myxococcota bacterium]
MSERSGSPARSVPYDAIRSVFLFLLLGTLAPSAGAQVVISQVYGGNGSTFAQDYVELFNRGAAPVSLSGRSIQYSSATGTGLFSANGISLLSGTLQPGQYQLVGLATAASGAPLPTPLLAGSSATNMSSTSGKVVLVDSTTGLACNGGSTPCSPTQQALILDLVGYGTANFAEGGAAAPAATSTTALFRSGSGCIDTSSNAADFTTGVPSPRTSSSPLHPCPTGTTVELSLDAPAGSEANGTVITATVTASEPVVGDQTVALSVSGSGITPGDYTLSTPVVTIPNGGIAGSALFTIVDDVVAEGTEIATLTLASPSAGIALGAVVSRTVTIADNDGCGSGATKIHDVQGAAASTPLAGVQVVVEGIVVGRHQGTATDSLQGFFVQEEDADADADASTSEGIFVFEGATGLGTGVAIGDRVRVAGTAVEFFGATELSPITSVEICASGQPIPTAADVILPVPNVPNGDLAAATSAINAYFEPFEGMRVRFPATLSIVEYFELERYGQLVLSAGGRIRTFTDANPPSVTGWIDHQIEVAKRTLILDDRDNRQNSALTNGRPLPYPAPGLSITNPFRGGDQITGLTGVLSWTFAGLSGTDAWRLRPVPETESYVFAPVNPRPGGAPAVGGTLEIASFNVLNYFTTIDTTTSSSSGPCGPDGLQDCRGADSAAELVRQTDKLVAALCSMNPDVAGLMEVENDTFATLGALVTAANAVPGCGPYAFVNTSSIGGDAIKVALLYKTTTVSTVGPHAILDSTVDPRFIDTKNRPVLAQTFVATATGSKWTVAVAHLKSKGSACDDVGDPDANDGQGNCAQTRKAAAQALVDWLASDPTASGDPDFLVIGDLNSYAQEDPIRSLKAGSDDVAGTSDDYTDLVDAFVGASAYGYVFDGQIGRLDHALATRSFAYQVTGVAEWHINADEPPSFDYNDTIADAGEASFEAHPSALPLYAPDEFRTSDHDPIVIGLPEPETAVSLAVCVLALAWSARHAHRRANAGSSRILRSAPVAARSGSVPPSRHGVSSGRFSSGS